MEQQEFDDFRKLLNSGWLMAVIFWFGWVLGPGIATFLFGLISFFALREFITLSPTRRGDHRSLILAFFIVLPMQFILVGTATLRPVYGCSSRCTCSWRSRR